MEYDVTFSSGMADFGGVSACRLFRLDPESTAFILQSTENGGERLLLGDVRRLGPEALNLEDVFCGGCKVELSLNFIEKLKTKKMLTCEHWENTFFFHL